MAILLENADRVVEAAAPVKNDIVVLFGSDESSLQVLAEAKKRGLICIYCGDQQEVLRRAKEMADEVVAYSETVYSRLAEIPPEKCPNIMIDLLGKPEFLTNAVKLISPAGRIVLACAKQQTATYQMRMTSHKELDIVGLPVVKKVM